MNARERVFAAVLEAKGLTVVAHPARFALPALATTYTPDYFCPEEGVYYEVAGTRQAFSQRREKCEAFRLYYPLLALRVVRPDGGEYVSFPRRRLGKFERGECLSCAAPSLPTGGYCRTHRLIARKSMRLGSRRRRGGAPWSPGRGGVAPLADNETRHPHVGWSLRQSAVFEAGGGYNGVVNAQDPVEPPEEPSEKNAEAVAMGARGGRKAWERLSADQRSDIMIARWVVRRLKQARRGAR